MPFEDLTGNSGFTSDSEGAEANLDINMSEDSARNLWDVQAAIQQIAADFQTAVRAASDFNSYLISIRETSQTVRMPSLGMEGGEGGNMSYAGGRVDTSSVPGGGLIGSEVGQAERIGEMLENASGAGGGAMAARAPGGGALNAGELVNQLTQVAWLSSAGGGPEVPQETAAAYNQDYNWALRHKKSSMVTGSQYGGQSGTARTFAASRLIANNLPAAQQFLTGRGAGGIMGALRGVGIAGAGLYAGYQLVDAGLQTYAQSRALAIATNNSQHGFGWGLEQQANQSLMSLSPFVTGEEVSQIYNSAIQQGWASRTGGFPQGDFSSAVNFMYDAAKDYNISPQQSAQLLQTNVLGAGESVAALSEQLLTLKKTLDGTGVSMSAASDTFQSFTSFLIGAGASPGDAAVIAGGTIKSFAQNTYLGPNASGAATVQAALQNPTIQNIIGAQTGNFGGAALAGGNAQQSIQQLQGLIHNLAVQYSSMTGMSLENRAALFRIAYNQLTGQNIDQRMATELMAEAAADPNFVTKGQNDYVAASTLHLEHQNSFQSWWQGLDDIHGWASTQTGGARSIDDQEKNSALINSYNYYSPEVNTLLQSAGDKLQDFVLTGPDGKPIMQDGNRVAGANIAKWFSDQANYAKFNDPKSGLYIQGPGSEKYTYSNIGTGGSTAGATAAGATDANTVYITLSPQAKAWFDTNKDKLNLSDGKNKSGG